MTTIYQARDAGEQDFGFVHLTSEPASENILSNLSNTFEEARAVTFTDKTEDELAALGWME